MFLEHSLTELLENFKLIVWVIFMTCTVLLLDNYSIDHITTDIRMSSPHYYSLLVFGVRQGIFPLSMRLKTNNIFISKSSLDYWNDISNLQANVLKLQFKYGNIQNMFSF